MLALTLLALSLDTSAVRANSARKPNPCLTYAAEVATSYTGIKPNYMVIPDKTRGYSIQVTSGSIFIIGRSAYDCLHATYKLLEQSGCRWLAPDLPFYHGQHEYVPPVSRLTTFDYESTSASARFTIRKLYVEEGLSHTTESLRAIIEWMPKAGYNWLSVPMDYGNRARVKWDHWRDALTSEIQTRGITLEVGGHGYENFIDAKSDNGRLYTGHPEWFGQDEKGRRSRSKKIVFCTSNPAARAHVFAGVVEYLKARPEIDVFDFWPPDAADWCQCHACTGLGVPPERQALLVNEVAGVLKKNNIHTRLEIIAYSKALDPPATKLPEDLLVDFCPINQSFETGIGDPASPRNSAYADSLTRWASTFPGDIGIYSYYRKYAWKSLPVVIPAYHQQDLQWYSKFPSIRGIGTYAEPGDWAAYELNHYMLARLAWNPDLDVAAEIVDFCRHRYAAPVGYEQAAQLLTTMGDELRHAGSIPFTAAKSAEETSASWQRVHAALNQFNSAEMINSGFRRADAGNRLRLSAGYALRDLELQHAKASGATTETLTSLTTSLSRYLDQHQHEGIVIRYSGTALDRLLKKYAKP